MIIEQLIALTRLVVKILAELTPTNKELYGCTDQCKNSKPHEHTKSMFQIDRLRNSASDLLSKWQESGCVYYSLRKSFECLQEKAKLELETYRQENGI